MTWLISNAMMNRYGSLHYSQGQAAESSEAICLDGEPSALLSAIPTQLAYCSPDKMTEFCRLSRFGMMFAPLTEDRGEVLLMWYLADFPARTYQPQEKAQELPESAAASGQKWRGLLAKYDPDTHSLKTAQCSLLGDWTESFATLPRWGLMRNGGLYLRQIAVRRTCAKGYGLWATPTTMDKLPPKSAEALEREATQTRPGRSKPANLRDQVSNMQNWPTPQASDNRDRGNLSTPAIKRRMEKGRQVMLSMCVSEESGQLNPEWVEWLMGWPLGWTDLKPLGMDRFQEWQQQHLPSYREENKGAA